METISIDVLEKLKERGIFSEYLPDRGKRYEKKI